MQGWDRVECTAVAEGDAMSQVPGTFATQIVELLQTVNFSRPGTEITSREFDLIQLLIGTSFEHAITNLEVGFCSFEITRDEARGVFHWNETEVGHDSF